MARKAATPKKTAKKSSSAKKTATAAKAPATKKKAVKKATKAAGTTKRKSRAKKAVKVRLKAFWGVYSQTLKQVAIFEYSQRKQADKKAGDLSTSQRTPHFVKLIKEVIEEE